MKLNIISLVFFSLFTLCFSWPLYAIDMNAAYSAGENFGESNQSTSQQDAKAPNYNTVPGYEGPAIPEASYTGDLNAQASKQILSGNNPAGDAVVTSSVKNPQQAAPESVIDTGSAIQSKSAGAVNQSHLFCKDDTCTDTTYTSLNPATFAQSVSALTAATDAGKDLTGHPYQEGFLWKKHWVANIQTFKGSDLACREIGVVGASFSNCCADSGWGQGVGIASCNTEENVLGKAKEKDLCIYVGEYCSDKTLGVCTENKKSYCCFDSMLAKIIQEQGRAQLHWTFGEAEYPDCRGFSPAQLQQIDFSKIDFSEYYATLEAQMAIPDSAAVQQQLQRDLQVMFKKGDPT